MKEPYAQVGCLSRSIKQFFRTFSFQAFILYSIFNSGLVVGFGALSITIIVYGLPLMGMSDSHISQPVEGGLLLILFITILTNRRKKVKEENPAPAAGEAATN